ncbi:MAG: RNA methyltransferase [Bacteroidetes bacterium]|nr:MAG: RNA methyltransferase [Bacteroidota bacterium]PIE88415.1 MAG: RNA methyltransferase [Bacteroidota bacterium]
MTDTYKMLALTQAGLEPFLKEELMEIGATQCQEGIREVEFEGTLQTMYRANMYSRLAVRILVPITSFEIEDETSLYEQAKAFNWNQYLSLNDTFNVEAAQVDSPVKSSRFAGFRVKDAIVDRFREQFGKRPFVEERHPEIIIHVMLKERQCTFSLDSSGMPLSWRSYRANRGVAPLNEVFAAGLLKLSGWDPKSETLYDPMTGSGTLLIEAALMAANSAPGLFRNKFGFMNWRNFEPGIWRAIQREAREKVTSFPSTQLWGADIDSRAVQEARENIRNAGFGSNILLKEQDFINSKPVCEPGVMILDLPLAKDIPGDLDEFYRSVGSTMKLHYPGFRAFILSADRRELHQIGLRPSSKTILYNGKLTSQLNGYELYHKGKEETTE